MFVIDAIKITTDGTVHIAMLSISSIDFDSMNF